jgi:putative endonuclease
MLRCPGFIVVAASPLEQFMADWYVYILQCADGTLYTGIATDVDARLVTHNAGKGAKYTRGRLPARLLYREKAGDRSAALKREHAIKRLSAAEKRALVAAGTPDLARP